MAIFNQSFVRVVALWPKFTKNVLAILSLESMQFCCCKLHRFSIFCHLCTLTLLKCQRFYYFFSWRIVGEASVWTTLSRLLSSVVLFSVRAHYSTHLGTPPMSDFLAFCQTTGIEQGFALHSLIICFSVDTISCHRVERIRVLKMAHHPSTAICCCAKLSYEVTSGENFSTRPAAVADVQLASPIKDSVDSVARSQVAWIKLLSHWHSLRRPDPSLTQVQGVQIYDRLAYT